MKRFLCANKGMNKYERIPDEIIDLHGYTVKEAERALADLLARGPSHVRLVVGKGIHGGGKAVLRDAVKSYLAARHIHFLPSKQKDGGEGALEVFF